MRQSGKTPGNEKRYWADITTGARRPLDLSVSTRVQPFTSLGEPKRSPITSDSGTARHPEPSSAQSRSQNESALVTPTSLTSHSESASLAGNPKQDLRAKRNSGYGPKTYQERPSTWVAAKEFQPSVPTNAIRAPVSGSDLSRGPVTSFNTSQSNWNPVNALETIWSQNDKHQNYGRSARRNDFRPVLSASDNAQHDRFGNDPRFDEMTDRFSRLNSNQQHTQRVEFRPNSYQQIVPNTSRVRQNKVQDRQGAEPYPSGAWHQGSYGQSNNLQITGMNESETNSDRTYMPTTTQASNGLYQNDFVPKYGLQQGAHAANPTMELNHRSRQQYSNYPGQAIQPFIPQAYNDNYFATNINGLVDVRNGGYGYDSTLATPYGFGDSALDRQNEPNQICRSPLLEEFRMNGKTKKYELKDIYDHIVEFSGDQLGSRFIQHKLEVANSDEKDRVFTEIARDSRQLMTDVFGNYVIQKMFEHGSQSQKKVLASHMKGHVYALSTQTYGCRVVQKALEHILTDQQASLIKELDGCVLKVVENQNGNHVIQKAIERVPGEHIQFIVDAHRGHVHYLSKHAYGCRVIQRMLEHCQPRAKRIILDELHLNIFDLIQDAFGNYVVQHVIVNGEPQDRKPVIDKVQSKLLENAMHKFASNVVEKALDYAEEEQCRAMLGKLTSRDETGQSQIIKLLSHQYGNYVIRKCTAHSHLVCY